MQYLDKLTLIQPQMVAKNEGLGFKALLDVFFSNVQPGRSHEFTTAIVLSVSG
jgi:hypothetical protein